MKRWKRFLHALLALVMVLTMLPVTAPVAEAVEDDEDVAINAANFPDENFRSYVKSNFDTDKNNWLSPSERSAVTSIDVSGKSITTLQGVELFPALKTLNCYNNQLTELDVSHNTALTRLECYSNQLTELDVSTNTELTTLTCYSNQLTELDLSANTALKTLRCSNNQLTELNLNGCDELKTLYCGNNHLTSLKLSSMDPAAVSDNTIANCTGNPLIAIDVSHGGYILRAVREGTKHYSDSTVIYEMEHKQGYYSGPGSYYQVAYYERLYIENTTSLILSQPADVSAKAGETAKYTVTIVSEDSELAYQWYFRSEDGSWIKSDASGNATPSLNVPVNMDNQGTYRCRVTLSDGREFFSDEATLLVEAEITAQPQDARARIGDTAVFTVGAVGNGLTYRWQSDDGSGWTDAGSTTDTLLVTATAALNGRDYRCVITDVTGKTMISNTASLYVMGVTAQPADAHVDVGSTATFTVTALGTGLTYRWQYQEPGGSWTDCTAGGCSTATLSVTATAQQNNNQYRCVVTDENGLQVTSDAATLTIKAFIIEQSGDAGALPGNMVQFTVSAVGNGLTYCWQYRVTPDSAWVNSDRAGCDTDTLTVTAEDQLDGHQFRCLVTDDKGSTAASQPAALYILAVTAQPADVAAESGETVTFTVSAKGWQVAYQWQYKAPGGSWTDCTASGSKTDTLSVAATVEQNNYQYRCVVTDASGLRVTSNAATLTIKAFIADQSGDVGALPGSTVRFTVSAVGNGLTYCWQYRVTSDSAWVNSDRTGCDTDTLTVTAEDQLDGYQFRCLVTDDKGSTAVSQPAALYILAVTAQPADAAARSGETVTFTVSAKGWQVAYQWQYKAPGGSWTNATTPDSKTDTLSVAVTTSRDSYQYRCLVTDASGNAVYSEAAALTVKAGITAQPRDTGALAGATVAFTVGVDGVRLTYRWQNRASGNAPWTDCNLTGSNTATLRVKATEALDGYQYRCLITDATGDTITSEAAGLYILAITAQPESVSVPQSDTAILTVSAKGLDLTYCWEYGGADGRSWTENYYDPACQWGNSTNTFSICHDHWSNAVEQFRCRVTDASGNVVYSAPVTVRFFTRIWDQPADVWTADGATAAFSVTFSGDHPAAQWQYRAAEEDAWTDVGEAGPQLDQTTLNVTAAADLDGCQYRCVFNDATGVEVCSEPATLHVTAITAQPEDADAEADETVSFAVEAMGVGLTYRWQYRTSTESAWRDSDDAGYNTPELCVIASADRNGYQYRCRISDSKGNTVYSDAATLTIRISIIAQPETVMAKVGEIAAFTVDAAGAGLKYHWQYRTSADGTWKSSGATGYNTDTLKISATAARNGYQYRCRISDSNGSTVYSDAATLEIAASVTTQPQDACVKVGETAAFTVKAAGSDLKYQWQYRTSADGTWKSSGATGCKTATLKISATAARNGYQYRCKITDAYNNTVYSDAATLKIAIAVTAQPKSVRVKAGETVPFTVTATGVGLKYHWQYRTSASGTWKSSGATGCSTATLKISATAARNGYQYRCKITDSNGSTAYSNAATLTVESPAKITSQPRSVTATAGDTVKFTVGATGIELTYQWQYRTSSGGTWKNSTTSGCKTATLSIHATEARNGYQYRCAVSDSLGNTVYSNAATLTVEPVLRITSHPSSCTVTAGDTASFRVSAAGSGLSYRWQYRTSSSGTWSNFSTGSYTSSTLSFTATSGRSGYQFRCRVTDSAGSTVYSNAATLTVKTSDSNTAAKLRDYIKNNGTYQSSGGYKISKTIVKENGTICSLSATYFPSSNTIEFFGDLTGSYGGESVKFTLNISNTSSPYVSSSLVAEFDVRGSDSISAAGTTYDFKTSNYSSGKILSFSGRQQYNGSWSSFNNDSLWNETLSESVSSFMMLWDHWVSGLVGGGMRGLGFTSYTS